MYSNRSNHTFLNKIASFTLAVFLFLSPLDNVSFAGYDDPNLGSYLSRSSVTNAYSPFSQINLHDGSFSQAIELALPSGRNGQNPALSIGYSSSNKGNDVLGYSWQLDTVSIDRFHDLGVDKLYDTDAKFVSSLDGELVEVGSGQYRVKRETGSFRTYQKTGNTWVISNNDGSTFTLDGVLGGAFDPNDNSRVGTWNLTSQVDVYGNEITYSYTTANGVSLLDDISYVEQSGGGSLVSVQFIYENRSDVIHKYSKGFNSVLGKRLSGVNISLSNAGVIKSYDFVYGVDDNGVRSLLQSVIEDGSLALYDFEYSDHQNNWQNDVDLTLPLDVVSGNGSDSGARFADVNGDGRQDIIKMKSKFNYPEQIERSVILNTPNGWETSSDFTLPIIGGGYGFTMHEASYSKWRDGGGMVVDVNGDGFDDFLWGHTNGYNSFAYKVDSTVQSVFTNNKDGTWSEDPGYSLPSDIVITSGHNDAGTRILDLNGDGLVDLMRINGQTTVYLNTGSGWQQSTDWQLPSSVIGHTYVKDHLKFGDVNNDGLVDFLFSFNADDGDQYYNHAAGPTINVVYLNTGSGWIQEPSLTIPTDFGQIKRPSGNRQISSFTHLLDINADGLVDIVDNAPVVQSYGIDRTSVYLNTGNGWQRTSGLNAPQVFAVERYNSYYPAFAGTYVMDIDGDGEVDFLRSGPEYPGWSSNVVKSTTLNKGGVPGLLKKVTVSTGGNIEITYGALHEQILSGEFEHTEMPFNRTVVLEEKNTSLYSPEQITTYQYKDAGFYYEAPDNRRFAGFGSVTKTTNLNKATSYYHQGNAVSTTTEENIDGESLIGLVYKTEVTDLADNLYTLNRSNFATTSLGNDSTFVKLESDLTLQYDGDGDKKASANSYTYSSTHGSLLTQTAWGEVNGNTDGTFSDTGSDDRKTAIEYATNASGMVLPSKQTLKDDSNNKVQESRFYYDNQAFGSVTLGNLTKQEDWVEGSAYVDTEWTYDSYGNVLTETDPRNYVRNYVYDAYNLYPASIANSLNQTTQYEYDYSSGQVATTTNVNGEVFVANYDGFGRPLSVIAPDPQTGNPVIQTTYQYTDTPGAVSVKQTNHLSDTLTNSSYSYFDGFGQVIQERQEAEGINQYAVRDYFYGDNGLLEKESLPYFSNGSARTTATTNAGLLSSYTYDALGRVTMVGTAIGNTSTAYDQWQETITDTAGNDKGLKYDAFGRLVTVTENEGVSSFDTEYIWDDRDNLIKITDADGNLRNITYDGLGRRTTLEDLHDPADSTFGEWNFSYDAAGNLTSTTDPNNQTTNYTYDSISRILVENYTGQAGTEVTYTYDTCTNGIGALCSVANSDVTTSYTYTPNSLVASEAKLIGGTTYTTSYEYDQLGNQNLVTYPDNSEVKYTLNKAGQATKVEQKENGGTFRDVVTNADYGPHGQLEYVLNGNGSETTRTYDATELYRLKNILTTATSSYGIGNGGEELAEIEAELATFTAVELDSVVETPLVIESLVLPGTTIEQLIEEVIVASSTETEDVSTTVAITATEFTDEEEIISTSTDDSEVASTAEETAEVIESDISSTTEESIEVVASTSSISGPSDHSKKEQATTTNNKPDKLIDVPAEMLEEIDNVRVEFKNPGKSGIAKAEMMSIKPEVKFSFWNNEADFSVAYEKVKGKGRYNDNKKLMEWGNGKEKVHAYPLPETDLMEDGGFEIEVVLEEKPKTNIFDFKVNGAEEFDFFYQSGLDEDEYLMKEENLDYCTATKCVNLEGETIAERAENIVGSYAVYHKDKRGSYDYMDYKTGKAFHILRPKAIDADENEVWAEMDYSNGVLSVTVPKNFLASATYPVRVDPTFGKTSVGGSVHRTLSNYDRISAIQVTPPNSGFVSSVTFFSKVISGGATNNAGIYTDNNGLPGSRLSYGSNVSVNTTATWRNSNSSYEVTAGENYWLAMTTDFSTYIYYDSVPGARAYKYNNSNSYPRPLPASLPGVSFDNKRFSIYVNYTLNEPPASPTLLETNGQKNPIEIDDSTPGFTAVYNDPNVLDKAKSYQVQVSKSVDFSSIVWDSGKTVLPTTAEGSRSSKVSYDGGSLVPSTQYYWRIKFWDNADEEGVWSNETAKFRIKAEGINVMLDSFESMSDGSMDMSSNNLWKQAIISVDDGDWQAETGSTPSSGTGPTDGSDGTVFIYTEASSNKSCYGSAGNVCVIEADIADSVDGQIGFDYHMYGSASLGILDLDAYDGSTWTNLWSRSENQGNQWNAALVNWTAVDNYTHLRFRVHGQTGWKADVALDNILVSTTTPVVSGTSTTPTFPTFKETIQDLSYVYDSVGNIIRIDDTSETDTAGTRNYSYDDLYRLTSAYTTAASTTGYNHTYSYSDTGNIITKSDVGDYAYDGVTGNPHAATTIGGVTQTYDDNGNLVSTSDGLVNTWNYRNELVSSTKAGNLTTFTYDHTGQRVKKVNDTNTTLYPSKLYSVEGSIATKHIYVGDMLVATIEDDTPAPKIYYNHLDHLGSTNVVTGGDGYMNQLLSYLPFGETRIDEQYDVINQTKRYTGHQYDQETELNYMGARYYDGQVGRFTAQDPVAHALGDTRLVEQKIGLPFETYLRVPQSHNTYSYAMNNPIIVDDSTGESSLKAWLIAPGATALQVGVGKLGSIGLHMAGRPASAELFSRSFNLNPGDTSRGNGSAVSNSVLNSPEYNAALANNIAENPGGGTFDLSLRFQSGDAQTAIGRMDLTVNAKPLENGSYQVSTQGTDTYDFDFSGDYSSPFVGTVANIAAVSQRTEAISVYDTSVSFEHEYTPERKREKHDN